MIKIFFIGITSMLLSPLICTQSHEALDKIKEIIGSYNHTLQNGAGYHTQLLHEIHTQCSNVPGICTKEETKVLGYEVLIGTGILLGVGGTILAHRLTNALENIKIPGY